MSEYEPLQIAIPAACLERWETILEDAVAPKVEFRPDDFQTMAYDAHQARGRAIADVLANIRAFHTKTTKQP